MIHIKDILTLDRTIFSATAQSKKKALELIAETVSLSVPTLPAHDIFDGMVERERLGTTAIGHGVAIPHCRLEQAESAIGCFVHLQAGIDFDAEDHLNVDMLFSLIVPMEATNEHLELLAQIAKIFRQQDNRQRFINAKTRIELFQRLQDV